MLKTQIDLNIATLHLPNKFNFLLTILTLSLLFCSSAFSTTSGYLPNNKLIQALDKSNKEKLFNSTSWLRLLHYRVSPNVAEFSDISSPEFFLSYDKNSILPKKQIIRQITPKQEMLATIKAFYEPLGKDTNLHPQCRFPARYLWLDAKIDFSKYGLQKVTCNRLDEWVKFKSLKSVSLIMVSGYFGNPASTFGHLLVKLNNSEFKKSSGNLLDQSINYGAKVPDNEPLPKYIFKGIFGGYVSRFSNKEFYSQDLIYSKQEYRDMWEYELNLNPYQNRLLVFHLWEMLGMESDYYFLKENCGYRIAELLELVTDQKLTPDRHAWYLPLTVFQKLEEVKRSRFIKKITFLPSSQRKLYHGFEQLNNKEKKIVNTFLRQDKNLGTSLLNEFTDPRKSLMIEVMLQYYQYKLSDTDISETQTRNYKDSKKHWVLERLKLVSGETEDLTSKIPDIVSPAKGAKPLLFQIGITHNKKRGTLLELGLTGIHYDLLSNSRGSLKNMELKFLDTLLNVNEKSEINLKKLDVVSILKLGLNNTQLYGESDHSWRVKTGFKQNNLDCKNCTNFYIEGGIGIAKPNSKNVITFAMLDAGYHADDNEVNLTPNIGLIYTQNEKLKSVFEAGVRIGTETGDDDTKLKFESRYSFSKNNSLRVSYEKDRGEQINASFYHNW